MRILRLMAVSAAAALGVGAMFGNPADLETARRQFVEFYLGSEAMPGGNVSLKDSNEPPPDTSAARSFVRSMRPDGSWPDLDYASKANSGWPPERHWSRLLAITAAARLPRATVDRGAFDAAIHRAFGFWAQHDFICPNWWYNQIGIPKMAATTALLLGDELKPEERRYLTETMLPRAKIGMTGQNRVWLAGNTLMLGLLKDDPAIVRQAADVIWSEVTVTTDEGIEPDFSFHQHGPQQQFGNYGMSLAVEICRWGTVLRGTPWAMPLDRLETYRRFLLEGEAWVIWRGRMDVSSCDRQLMPRTESNKAKTIAQVMRNAAVFDRAEAPAYHAFLARNANAAAPNDLVGNRVFWRSDYVIHRRPDFEATLKLCSRRVVGTESINDENLLGYHLADGALYLYRRGDEYADIFPVWDWQKLPGVTCAQLPAFPPKFRDVRGERDFVGGVSDDTSGVAVLDFARDGVAARKSWFMGENAIVCLGTDIRSNRWPATTTINQCLQNGPVTVKQRGADQATLARVDQVFENLEWVEHDGWRYTFEVPTTAHVRAGPQTGNWKRIFNNPETPKADVTRDVFALWVEHEAGAPQGYAYTIARIGTPAASSVVINSPVLQVVKLDAETFGAAFWSRAEAQLPPELRLAVDAPCLVIVKPGSRQAFVADPSQKRSRLTLTVNDAAVVVNLPQGGEAGRTVKVNLP